MPKISAPNGRKAKAAAKSASAAIVPAVGFKPAKKTFWIVVASEPKMKKSYHSNAVPVDDAAITRAIDQVRCCGCSAVVAICAPLVMRDSGPIPLPAREGLGVARAKRGLSGTKAKRRHRAATCPP